MKALSGHEAERTRELIEWVWIGGAWVFLALGAIIHESLNVAVACAFGLIVFEVAIHLVALWWSR